MKNKLLEIAKTLSILTLTIALLCLLFSSGNLSAASSEEKDIVILSSEEVAKELRSLTQYEIDKAFLLSQAMDNINDPKIRDKFLKFREEGERIIKKLASLTQEYGGKPPSYSKDFKGYFIQGYVAMRGLTSDLGVLQALKTNEEFILKAYERALKLHFFPNVRTTVEEFYQKNKELEHYITDQIKQLL